MMLRRVTDFILRSRLQAILAAFVFALIPVIGNINSLIAVFFTSLSFVIAAFITLRKGALEGALVTIAAALPSLVSFLFPGSQLTGVEIAFGLAMIASGFLTWVLAVVLERYAHWSFVLEVSGLIGIFMVVAIHVLYPDVQTWWQKELTNYFNQMVELIKQADPDVAVAQAKMLAQTPVYATFMTGFVVSLGILLNALLQVFLGRFWQAAVYNPAELRRELYQIRLSYVAAVIFIASFVFFYWGNPLVSDIMPVLILTFCLAGLSLVHFMAAQHPMGWLWLGLVYLMVLFIFPAGAIFVSIIALLDAVLNIRNRYVR